MLDVRVFHPLGPDGRKAGKYTLTANEKDKYDRYPTHKDGRRLTNATIVPIVVNTFGAVGEKAQYFFQPLGNARELVDLVSDSGCSVASGRAGQGCACSAPSTTGRGRRAEKACCEVRGSFRKGQG